MKVAVCMLLGYVPVSAQEVSDDEEITVVAPYQPSVSEAKKINVSPKIPEENLEKPTFNYSILSKALQPEPTLDPIQPAKIKGESVPKLYKNYLKAGIGNYTTPYLEFFANKLRSKKNAFGVHLKHRSSAGKIKDYAYPGNAITSLEAYGKKFLKENTLYAGAYYKRRGIHFYGFKPDDFPELSLENKDIRQTYQNLGIDLSFFSNYKAKKKFHYDLSFAYSYLFDRFEAREHKIHPKLDLELNTTFFDFSELEKLALYGDVEFYNTSDSVLSNNSGIIRINPSYAFGFDQYYFKLGLLAAIERNGDTKAHIYPQIRAEVKVVQDYLITYAGIYGSLDQNSLHSLSVENPFINATLEKRFTNNKISQFGGVKGRISKNFNYNVSFVNSTMRDMPFFVNDTVSALGAGINNQFTVVYDDVKNTRLMAEIGYTWKNSFHFLLRGQYNDYFLDNEDEAWHKPGLELSFGTHYNFQDKIVVKAQLFTRSKIFGRDFRTDAQTGDIQIVPVELKAMTDLNLGVEYRYSSVLSGFIDLNNILGQRYFLWYNYPSYRFNLLLGVTYSF